MGRWHCAIDGKWRLSIPVQLNNQFNDLVLLEEGSDGCIRMKNHLGFDFDEVDNPSVFEVKVNTILRKKHKEREYLMKRITIPDFLRQSTSFYFGRKVILADQGSYFELWPGKL